MAMNVNILSGDEKSQKLMLQACVPFMDLKDNAKFFYRQDPSQNPYNTGNEDNDKSYQRRIDEKRVKEIKRYIKNAILTDFEQKKVAVIFPTAMLLAVTIDDTSFSVGDISELTMPQDFYIVDGQHRLYSMISLYHDVTEGFFPTKEDSIVKEYLERYRFNCTIMLNFDIWEQAQVFAEVNFNQKRVSKSLYYDIYGMEYTANASDREKNFIYISHKLVRFMNTNVESPFYHKIKMLGTGRGYVSQACMAEALMAHMSSPQGIWYIDMDKVQGKPSYRYMAVELISFYKVVQTVFHEYWPKYERHNSILTKTTGVGAMIKLMGYIHTMYISEEIKADIKMSESYLCKPYMDCIKSVLSCLLDDAKDLFSFEGHFSGTGGRGLESSLYKTMCGILSVRVR